MVIERVPSVEMVRFVNSGTEACLSVLRLMRAYTKRDKVPPLPGTHTRRALCDACVKHTRCYCFDASGRWSPLLILF